MKPVAIVFLFTLVSGCVSQSPQRSTAQPFAVLYGQKKAQWLSSNQRSIFLHKNDKGDMLDVEIGGFQELDAKNQKLYLVVRYCTHQPGNAEDGSQMWRLMSALKCPKADLASYIASLDDDDIRLYAAYLGGSIEQFRNNAQHYLQ